MKTRLPPPFPQDYCVVCLSSLTEYLFFLELYMCVCTDIIIPGWFYVLQVLVEPSSSRFSFCFNFIHKGVGFMWYSETAIFDPFFSQLSIYMSGLQLFNLLLISMLLSYTNYKDNAKVLGEFLFSHLDFMYNFYILPWR